MPEKKKPREQREAWRKFRSRWIHDLCGDFDAIGRLCTLIAATRDGRIPKSTVGYRVDDLIAKGLVVAQDAFYMVPAIEADWARIAEDRIEAADRMRKERATDRTASSPLHPPPENSQKTGERENREQNVRGTCEARSSHVRGTEPPTGDGEPDAFHRVDTADIAATYDRFVAQGLWWPHMRRPQADRYEIEMHCAATGRTVQEAFRGLRAYFRAPGLPRTIRSYFSDGIWELPKDALRHRALPSDQEIRSVDSSHRDRRHSQATDAEAIRRQEKREAAEREAVHGRLLNGVHP